MRILNRDALLAAAAADDLAELRADALAILERALDSVEPEMLVARSVTHDPRGQRLTIRGDPFAGGPGSDEDLVLDLSRAGQVRCLAAGKAAEAMLRGLPASLALADGFAVTQAPQGPARLDLLRGGHPVPTAESAAAGARALALARATAEDDVLLVLLSGGASAIMDDPLVSLDDLQATTRALLGAGATIEELNAVRKKLSGLKGGRLAAAARGRVVAFILSDVFEDHAGIAGSGPTAPDATTHGDALAILDDLGVAGEVPASARAVLQEGREGKRPETPKPGDPLFRRVSNVVLGSNALAAHEATQLAAEMGYNAFRVREPLRGSAQRAGWKLARMAEDVTLGRAPLPRPACVVYGGETTVDVRGSTGKGGRNQEAALAALESLKVEGLVAFLGTDGIDGPTDAAGALIDMGSKERAAELGLDGRDHLVRHDSHTYFTKLGGLLMTGPTGTNVADIAVVMVP